MKTSLYFIVVKLADNRVLDVKYASDISLQQFSLRYLTTYALLKLEVTAEMRVGFHAKCLLLLPHLKKIVF
jgi:hypothetical protein